ALVIAGSGMCSGGRILHHLRHNLWRRECHVMIIGYQSAGTLGRKLVDGNQFVRIYGEDIRVAATVHTVGGLSAHAGQDDLLAWYQAIAGRPPVHLVHGEERGREGLAACLRERLGVEAGLPGYGDRLAL
ncbi:MAG: MBL fold metallo-hydrolase RNA specificity domain-containing protein, partial [Pseudoxanthomonas sp.]|nr:MBL fold metallo-hydrolase RNA specificity domain-containing protein [Pseudoxanthomonas sp.]